MNLTSKLAIAGSSMAMAASLLAATPASADTNTYTVAYGAQNTANGTSTVDRTNNDVVITVNFSSGSTFGSVSPNVQICASTTAFTSRVNPSQCLGTPHGEYFSFNGTGSGGTFSLTLGAPFTSTVGYLQIHFNTLDNGVANTSYVDPHLNSVPTYDNVPTDPLPVEAAGALGLAAVAGGTLAFMQRRKRRALAS